MGVSMFKKFKNDAGRSMIEMLGVLAIMSILTVGAFTMVNNAMRSSDRLRIQDEITLMAQNVKMLMSEYEDFSNIDSAIIFSAIGVSNKNPYGGTYEIAADPANPRQFVISITGLPRGDCEFFKIKGWTDSAEYIKSEGKRSGAVATPADCSDANGNNKISITFLQ